MDHFYKAKVKLIELDLWNKYHHLIFETVAEYVSVYEHRL